MMDYLQDKEKKCHRKIDGPKERNSLPCLN
jgi:hypothetical protein